MAKDKERKIAQDYYVTQGLNAKQIAEKGLATEKTIGNWVNKYGWKKLRDAKQNSTGNRLDRINQVTDNLADQRLKCSSVASADSFSFDINLSLSIVFDFCFEIFGIVGAPHASSNATSSAFIS